MATPGTAHPRFLFSSLALGAATFLLAACAGPTAQPRGLPPPRQAPLTAAATYFGGALSVETRLTRYRFVIAQPSGPAAPAPHTPALPPPGAGGPGAPRHHSAAAMDLPGQTIQVTFTNRSAAPLTFTVTELNSLVGNFAPQPATFTLAPGASEALSPVSGDAGGIVQWLDLTLALRRDGSTESQVLRLVPAAAGDAPPAP